MFKHFNGNVMFVRAENCAYPSRTHFQRVAGHEAVGSRYFSMRMMNVRDMPAGLLIACINQCGSDPLCLGLNYNAVQQTCSSIEEDFRSWRLNASENILLRPTSGMGYFESLCLQGTIFLLLYPN